MRPEGRPSQNYQKAQREVPATQLLGPVPLRGRRRRADGLPHSLRSHRVSSNCGRNLWLVGRGNIPSGYALGTPRRSSSKPYYSENEVLPARPFGVQRGVDLGTCPNLFASDLYAARTRVGCVSTAATDHHYGGEPIRTASTRSGMGRRHWVSYIASPFAAKEID